MLGGGVDSVAYSQKRNAQEAKPLKNEGGIREVSRDA
jgi:hypothetical protein